MIESENLKNKLKCSCRGGNLDKMIQPAILTILFNEGVTGPDIIKALATYPMFQDQAPDKAGVYRYLKKMEQDNEIRSEKILNKSNKLQNMYYITDEGKRCLIYWMDTLSTYSYHITDLTKKIRSAIKN